MRAMWHHVISHETRDEKGGILKRNETTVCSRANHKNGRKRTTKRVTPIRIRKQSDSGIIPFFRAVHVIRLESYKIVSTISSIWTFDHISWASVTEDTWNRKKNVESMTRRASSASQYIITQMAKINLQLVSTAFLLLLATALTDLLEGFKEPVV